MKRDQKNSGGGGTKRNEDDNRRGNQGQADRSNRKPEPSEEGSMDREMDRGSGTGGAQKKGERER